MELKAFVKAALNDVMDAVQETIEERRVAGKHGPSILKHMIQKRWKSILSNLISPSPRRRKHTEKEAAVSKLSVSR